MTAGDEEPDADPPASSEGGVAGGPPPSVGDAPRGSANDGANDEGVDVDDLGVGEVGTPSYGTAFRYGSEIEHRVRSRLAYLLFWLFAVTVVAGIALNSFLDPEAASQLNDWLERLLPAEVGVFGSALGFYYGSRS